MTDITELAHGNSLRKKLNRRLNDAYGFQRTSGGKHTTISLSIAECKSVIAALDERLALVEALEKAQQVDEELCRLLPPGAEYMDPPDGGDVTPLEGVRRMVADYRQRIAELESRTVKLPPCVDDLHGIGMVMSADAVVEALTSYGIKVEAE
ncbi:hypothetical protein BME90_11505 [Klebsiella quasipneumoniae subsp. similipneumoniae]|uniref:hypothetical protein n=1 Tax=Klebsiella quasipneumoniae TaxID=1463165 RepID=UPI000B41FB2F|nr:hypothetical protein [Klebsiella quasipneumoniae]OVT76310.1 hypothetical protein BME90_11505 [Klebsiella quasipneumoniae subsp. similipneumoniae]OVV22748.1 hypothetical protein BME89_01200 [Klebsiella quasipneumoniae subsp. similipneumoniae]